MSNRPQTRREFLRSAIRATLLGATAVTGVVLLRRQKDCTSRGGCEGCTISDDCSLPWKVAKR